MRNWMNYLACHYESMREKYPDDRLLILFDIDGTILDMRHTMHYLLKSYDQNFGTQYFKHLQVPLITFPEEELTSGLRPFCIPEGEMEKILCWYGENRWSMWSLFEANRPFPGVMEVIRWFQLQNNTCVGLNTARSEVLREETMLSLNSLGREFRVTFDDQLMKMHRPGLHKNHADSKVGAIREFQATGYRVIAMVDNEPENLEHIAASGLADEILLLHASTLFKSRVDHRQIRAVGGNVYDLTELIPRRALPQHIQFVWNNVNNDSSLTHFMKSNVRWADVTGVANDTSYTDEFSEAVSNPREFVRYISLFRTNGKGIRINFESIHEQADTIIDLLARHDVVSNQLWLCGKIDTLRRETYGLMSDIFPEAIIECPVDFLAPILLTTPEQAERILDTYTGWGINRFSLSWKTAQVKRVLGILDRLGFDITIRDINNLEDFLQAVLLLPTAIVTSFNFPRWEQNQAHRDNEMQVLKQA